MDISYSVHTLSGPERDDRDHTYPLCYPSSVPTAFEEAAVKARSYVYEYVTNGILRHSPLCHNGVRLLSVKSNSATNPLLVS